MIVDGTLCAHDAKATAVSLDGFMESTERSLMLESCRLKVCYFLFQCSQTEPNSCRVA
jgi:hypothetical protein